MILNFKPDPDPHTPSFSEALRGLQTLARQYHLSSSVLDIDDNGMKVLVISQEDK